MPAVVREDAGVEALETLFDDSRESSLLTPVASQLYGGDLGFPLPRERDRPYVIANFVSTIDGVVSYAIPGQEGGAAISGSSEADRFVMGLLRSLADAVLAGAGALRGAGGQPLTPRAICPESASLFASLRGSRPESPPAFILGSARSLDENWKVFSDPGVETLVLTTGDALESLANKMARHPVRIIAAGNGERLSPESILRVLQSRQVQLCLLEGGPATLSPFIAAGLVDELFLTLSPRLAGRDAASHRPALIEEVAFCPDASPLLRLVSLKRHRNHLFARYRFQSPQP